MPGSQQAKSLKDTEVYLPSDIHMTEYIDDETGQYLLEAIFDKDGTMTYLERVSL